MKNMEIEFKKFGKLRFLNFVSLRSKNFLSRLAWSGFLTLGFFLTSAHASEEFPKIKFSGDFRFRHEHAEKQGAAVSTYEHQRIRARLGTQIQADETTQIEFRLATGGGRTSTNQTLGSNSSSTNSTQSFANYGFLLDRANLKLSPAESLNLSLGRFANPFYLPGESDLIWDSDLNFDGASARFWSKNESISPFVNAGFFWVLKDLSAPRKDVLLGALQLGAQGHFAEDKKWSLEAGYYAYSGIRTHPGLTASSNTDGNTFEQSGSTRLYAKSFKLLVAGFDFSLPLMEKNLSFFNQYVTNTKANPSPGYIAGIKWGQLKEKGSWILNYDFRRLPEDATVGAFTDGDSFGGGTNGLSHKISTGYQVSNSWNLVLSYFYGKQGIMPGNTRLNRQLLQADLNAKF